MVVGDNMSKININMDSLKGKKEWKRHKVNPGHNTFRILPPFGDQANGYPYKKWMIIWGMLDPESGRMRPFASSLTTEKRCPVTEYVEALQKKAEAIKGRLQAAGKSEADIKEALKGINKVIGNLRPKTVYAYNAADKSGTVGILEVKSTAHKVLKTLMMTYIKDYNQDPTSLNSDPDDSGVWFDFIRTGEGFSTEYDVEKLQMKTKVNGQLTFVDDRSPLPENVVENYTDMAYDLSSIYQIKSYDDLKEILMANLKQIAKECPDAIVDGFSDFSGVGEIETDEGATNSQSGSKEASSRVSTTQGSGTNGKGKVNINLNDDDADDEAKPTSKASVDDDIFALADNILNS
jgi:hypothetical protein